MSEEITPEEGAARAKAWLAGQRKSKLEFRPEAYKKKIREENI